MARQKSRICQQLARGLLQIDRPPGSAADAAGIGRPQAFYSLSKAFADFDMVRAGAGADVGVQVGGNRTVYQLHGQDHFRRQPRRRFLQTGPSDSTGMTGRIEQNDRSAVCSKNSQGQSGAVCHQGVCMSQLRMDTAGAASGFGWADSDDMSFSGLAARRQLR